MKLVVRALEIFEPIFICFQSSVCILLKIDKIVYISICDAIGLLIVIPHPAFSKILIIIIIIAK